MPFSDETGIKSYYYGFFSAFAFFFFFFIAMGCSFGES
jgi:hypothetical protein